MIDKHIRFVVFRHGHHSPHSGYSRLAEYGVRRYAGEIIQVDKPFSRHIIRDRMLWRLAKGTPGYDRSAIAAELEVARHMLTEQKWIYHFLYGETNYHYVGQLNNHNKNRLVASFHLPPDSIRESVQIDWHLRQLSAVICLGHNQQEFFTKILDPQKVFFVPLGVDTEYYTPPPPSETRNPNLCLFVGAHLRDFPTLRGVIELVADRRPHMQFVAVMQRQSFGLLGTHPNLTLRSGIPESDFLALYRSAALMVMPLHDAVANNAVLECMACGLPLVVTDVGAVREYVSPECSVLIRPYDSRGMAEAVQSLLDNPLELQKMSKNAREQALKFSWPEVVGRLDSVYAAVA